MHRLEPEDGVDSYKFACLIQADEPYRCHAVQYPRIQQSFGVKSFNNFLIIYNPVLEYFKLIASHGWPFGVGDEVPFVLRHYSCQCKALVQYVTKDLLSGFIYL